MESKNKVHIVLYYGYVHFGSPSDVLEKVGQNVILVEESFKFKGDFTNEMLNQFTNRLFPELEKVVLEFWRTYPTAHVELYGTSPQIVIGNKEIGYWNKSEYIKLNHIDKRYVINSFW